MKILQIGTGLMPIPPKGAGAVETVIHCLSKELSYRGHEVCVIDISGNGKERAPYNFRVIPSNFDSQNKLGHVLRGLHFGVTSSFLLSKLLKKEKFDVVHFHNQFSAFWGIDVANRYKIPSVYTLHNAVWALKEECVSFRNKVKFGQEIVSMKKASEVIAVSRTLSDNVVQYLNISSHKIDIVPNGIDVNIFNPNIEHFRLKQKIAPNGETVFLNVARIARYKNQMSLVKAISYVVKEYSNVKFIFVGPIDDKRYFSQIQSIVLKENLQKCVKFYGVVSFEMLLKLYSLSDVFILPSVTEGLPLVILEAMACGKTVVASDIGPIRELIAGVGVLVNPYDVKEIGTILLSLVDDKEKREKMGKRARETVVNNFAWSVISDRVERIYEKLV